MLIDVRPGEEFAQGHIRGALSVPSDRIATWADTAPRKKQIVAYCRGPYCVYAVDAARELGERGLRVRYLADGVPEWRAAGLPVAIGEH